MLKPGDLTTLKWLAPSMARDGLIKNGDWVLPAAAEAAGVFADEKLHLAAQFLAVLDRFALDYVRQAPVIVVAVARRRNFTRRADRVEVGTRFIAECRSGTKLAALMKGYGLAPQLRQLSGQAVRDGQHNLLAALSDVVPPSTLAQSIPNTADEQLAWLRGLETWRLQMTRHFRDPNRLLAWAAARIQSNEARALAGDIADFAGRNHTTFNPDWSFEQARAASRRWHEELASRAPAAEAARPDWRTPIDYAPLPLTMEVDGYTFNAINTREALYAEGARMHHCVRLYADRVARGTSRIFSVRRNDERIATLELICMSRAGAATKRFELAQLKGPRNARPAADVAEAACGFLRSVNPPATAIAGRLSPEDPRGYRSCHALRRRLGEEVYSSWFHQMRFEAFDGRTLAISFPTKFLRRWVEVHYFEQLLTSCAEGFEGVQQIELSLRGLGNQAHLMAVHNGLHPH